MFLKLTLCAGTGLQLGHILWTNRARSSALCDVTVHSQFRLCSDFHPFQNGNCLRAKCRSCSFLSPQFHILSIWGMPWHVLRICVNCYA